MTVRLRPHHLLCLLTYAGRGYTPAFVANLDAVAARIAAGEAIEIVAGPDDICTPVRDDPSHHCHDQGIRRRDRLAAAEVSKLLHTPLVAGRHIALTPDRLRLMRAAFAGGRIRAACTACSWQTLCDDLAAGGFRETRLSHGA